MKYLVVLILSLFIMAADAQSPNQKFSVIGYYAGDTHSVDAYQIESLTHIIFSFCHLKGNELHVENAQDTATIRHLVDLKQRNPSMKVILSLGGWGGCGPCSQVFSTAAGRNEFASSVKHLSEYFETDGIDLDWEYPAIPGFEGHQYLPEDRPNFTALVQALRDTLGSGYEISFAAGGVETFLRESIEWNKIAPLVDKVNLMSYDLVHGNSKVTGHHTPLYSTPGQVESTDNAIRYFDSIGFPLDKVVIGAAMYGRIFDVQKDAMNGLYQPGKFDHGISFKSLDLQEMEKQGYKPYWDDVAKAPYLYNKQAKKLYTYDDARSMALKTQYAIDKGLNGIMFWQLADDKPVNGLLEAIHTVVEKSK